MLTDGNNKKTLIDSAIKTPSALAYDWLHGVLYWADSSHGNAKIEVVVVSNGHRHVLLTSPDVDNPRVLAVDPRPDHG